MAKAKKKSARKARPAVVHQVLELRAGDRVTVTRPGCYVGSRISTVRSVRGRVADIQIDGKHVTAEFPVAELAVI